MTLPTSYDATSIVAYMHTVLDTVDDIIVSAAAKWLEVANDILILYGVSDYASVTDMTKVRALAKMLAWKTAMEAASAWYKFSADGGSYDRNQIYEMCKKNYGDALNNASCYLTNYEVGILDVSPTQDPYIYDPDRIEMRVYNG